LLFATGIVLHAGREHRDDLLRRDDLLFAAKVEPHLASAVDRESKTLLLTTPQRTLQVYSYPDFKLQKSFLLEAAAQQMAFDAASGTLYCVVETKVKGTERLSELRIYDLKQALK